MAKEVQNNANLDALKSFMSMRCKKDDLASILSESSISNISDYIDSGSYILNKILSGSYFKGWANNRLFVIAGPSGVGKSLIAGMACANAQKKGYQVFYYDSENAIDAAFLQRIGCDPSLIFYRTIQTISEFRNTAVGDMKAWRENPKTKNIPALMVCDSIGGLMGTKEYNDVEAESSASDMGQRAKELRACSRALMGMCGKYEIPLIVTNHTYDQAASNPNAAPTRKMSGGEGFYYSASGILFIKKNADWDREKNADGKMVKYVKGNYLTIRSEKNRLVPEGIEGEVYISFEKGLNKYFGLHLDALEHGFFEKSSTGRWEVKHLQKKLPLTKLHKKEIYIDIINDLNTAVEKSVSFNSLIGNNDDVDDDSDSDDDVSQDVPSDNEE